MKKLLLLNITVCFLDKPSLLHRTPEEMLEKRLELFKNVETAVQLPWYYLAAADQYERSIRQARNDIESVKGNISIKINPAQWSGALNPNQEDTNPFSISVFNGMGKDGNGDHVADSRMMKTYYLHSLIFYWHMGQMKIISELDCGIFIKEIKLLGL